MQCMLCESTPLDINGALPHIERHLLIEPHHHELHGDHFCLLVLLPVLGDSYLLPLLLALLASKPSTTILFL